MDHYRTVIITHTELLKMNFLRRDFQWVIGQFYSESLTVAIYHTLPLFYWNSTFYTKNILLVNLLWSWCGLFCGEDRLRLVALCRHLKFYNHYNTFSIQPQLKKDVWRLATPPPRPSPSPSLDDITLTSLPCLHAFVLKKVKWQTLDLAAAYKTTSEIKGENKCTTTAGQKVLRLGFDGHTDDSATHTEIHT